MRVRLLRALHIAHDHVTLTSHDADSVVDVADPLALSMIRAKQAVAYFELADPVMEPPTPVAASPQDDPPVHPVSAEPEFEGSDSEDGDGDDEGEPLQDEPVAHHTSKATDVSHQPKMKFRRRRRK